MNREIKFRCYQGFKSSQKGYKGLRWVKKMVSWEQIRKSWSLNDFCTTMNEGQDRILMQFTGLTDKNGKEIYEGDKLRDTLTGMTYVVKFGFCKKFAYNGWYVENEAQNYFTSLNGDYSTILNSQIEVVGNIYENPDLLT